ncbi:MAG: histidinol-phosphate transaminase, partial [Eubacteriales bacterium]|nr:histidinol-phosphate transaminase [Eubacteriales bacterium]
MFEWEKNVRLVDPYTPGEQPNQPDMIKLNTNENPYPPSPKVAEALKNMDSDVMRLYPDPTVGDLAAAIAKRYGVEQEQVFVGVGSDDVIAMAFQTFFNSDKPILFPDITYSFYDVWTECFRIPYKTIPLNENFEICPEDYTIPCGGIIFPNPNAPTGCALPLAKVEQIVAQNRDVVVMVDEAYVDFGADSALALLEKYDNLLVIQTFSKSRSMAGMRIGYAIGGKKLIKYMQDVKYSFNSYTMNRPAIILGKASIEDEEYFAKTRKQIIETREWAKEELRALGFTFPDSMANFIFASHNRVPAKEIFAALREKHIYVR